MSASQTLPSQNLRPSKLKNMRWVALASSAFLIIGLVIASRPYREALRVRAENDVLEREVKQMREETRQYKREINALDSPEGRNLLGRRMGLVGANELRLNVPDK